MKNNYQDLVLKLNSFSKKFVRHNRANKALELMENAMSAVEVMRLPNGEIDPNFQPKDFNFKLVGMTGAGKTTLCHKNTASHMPFDEETHDAILRRVPCLYCSVESPPTIKNLAKSMLTVLGDPAPEKGTVYDVTTRVKNSLKRAKTNLIIIDEFHHLLHGSRNKITESLDWLKRLNDDTRVPVVVSGLPESLALFRSESQMAKRFPREILLSEHGWNYTKDDPGEFGQYCAPLLNFVEGVTEFKFDFKYQTKSFFKRLFVATAGLATDIDTLLKAVIKYSVERGSGSISLTDFASAYESVTLINSGYSGKVCPFTCDEKALQKIMRGMHV